MTLYDTVAIECDRCKGQRHSAVGEAPSELRERLKAEGWTMRFDRPDGEDRCDNCSDRR